MTRESVNSNEIIRVFVSTRETHGGCTKRLAEASFNQNEKFAFSTPRRKPHVHEFSYFYTLRHKAPYLHRPCCTTRESKNAPHNKYHAAERPRSRCNSLNIVLKPFLQPGAETIQHDVLQHPSCLNRVQSSDERMQGLHPQAATSSGAPAPHKTSKW